MSFAELKVDNRHQFVVEIHWPCGFAIYREFFVVSTIRVDFMELQVFELG